MDKRKKSGGFTILELLVVVAIIGILSLFSMPGILNQLEVRALENTARDIQASLQQTRLQAVGTKLNHRLRFSQTGTIWRYHIERETTPGVWDTLPGYLPKAISSRFQTTINFPVVAGTDRGVEYSPVGMVTNFSTVSNTYLVQSPKLKSQNQPDEMVLTVFMGGSIRLVKQTSA
jgi:prepilin-type N-terminal cleavage/methylation domain-containing protein